MIVGQTPVNQTTNTPSWVHQALEPCYSWNNVWTPTGRHVNNINPTNNCGTFLLPGHDYFTDTAMPGYTPYVYPHPLVSDGSPSPSPNPSRPSPTTTATPIPSDFNDDGKSDFLLNNPITLQTSVWYMRNHVRIGSAYGPTLWPGWNVAGVADFNLDGHPDYLLFRPDTGQTAMWHLNNRVRIGSAWGPTLWPGWNVAGVADFNLDGHPDYLLFRPDTGQTAIWYLNNNVRIGHSFGPTLWPGWNVAGVAILISTVIQIIFCSDPIRDRPPSGILTITCASVTRSAPRCGLAGTWQVWQILISTVNQITFCSGPIRDRPRYGILTIT